MKTWILTLAALGVIGVAAFTLTRRSPAPEVAAADEPSAETKKEPKFKPTSLVRTKASPPVLNPPAPVTEALPVVDPVPDAATILRQAVDELVSKETPFKEKMELWEKLKKAGQLGDVIAELERRAVNDPQAVEYPATLGQAYLRQAGATTDPREQGISGLTADRMFDDALKLDPQNWDAQYWKASGLSYWPSDMKKGPEVLQRLTDLIKQQESQTPRPEFAMSYVLLGEQYQKTGHAAEARQVWQRGAAFFPANTKLQAKVAAQ